ncbi:MAG: class D sortase [Xanthomonadales bacterium]|nr:class D sortase [Xanthomonadales bacterium]
MNSLARSSSLKKKLGWLELVLYLAGIVLIVVFLQVRAGTERLRQEGLQAFEENAARPVQQPSTGQAEASVAVLPADRDRRPNQALWTEKRIHEYEESLKIAGAPPVAVLSIEHLDINVPVYNGTDDFNLNRGVGRIIGTARVDADGNLGIAGHRDGFFRPLKDIEIGDSMQLRTAGGTVTYQVSSIEIVAPDDVSVLRPTQEKTLTLVTCYPFYYVGHAPKRYIVKATAEHFLVKT